MVHISAETKPLLLYPGSMATHDQKVLSMRERYAKQQRYIDVYKEGIAELSRCAKKTHTQHPEYEPTTFEGTIRPMFEDQQQRIDTLATEIQKLRTLLHDLEWEKPDKLALPAKMETQTVDSLSALWSEQQTYIHAYEDAIDILSGRRPSPQRERITLAKQMEPVFKHRHKRINALILQVQYLRGLLHMPQQTFKSVE